MTKLFEEDSYLKEFKTKIIDINENEKIIELEKTAFYAKSGGQPGDIGEIIIGNKSIEVLDTIKRNNKILNIMCIYTAGVCSLILARCDGR